MDTYQAAGCFCSGGDFLMTYLMAFSVRRSTIFVEEMKPNEFYFMFCWEKFQFVFLGAWFYRDRDMRIGMLLHLPGALSKTTVVWFQKNL